MTELLHGKITDRILGCFYKVGNVLNFGPKLEFQRVIFENAKKAVTAQQAVAEKNVPRTTDRRASGRSAIIRVDPRNPR
jgi:hypothetical protein